MAQRLKYSEHHAKLKDCPPKHFAPANREAYRFVFDHTDVVKNFAPALIINPRRAVTWDDARICDGYGLSFFDTRPHAENFFHSLKKASPMIGKRIGQFLAHLRITQNDGIQSKPSRNGHFTLHEYEDVTWNWTVVKELKNGTN